MPSPRLYIPETALLVIDLQEKLIPTIPDRERLVNNCAIMIQVAAELELPYLITEQYPQGLGRTIEPITRVMLDPAARVEKTRFSAKVEIVDDLLRSWRRTSVLICGIEAHVCVLQTVLDLQAAGRQCYLVSDAIAASQPAQVDHAVRRMEAAGAVTTSVMSAMYELLGDSKHPSLRSCVELAKRIRT